jgi:succinoglycan biosynthesis protein ExoM
MELHSDGVGAVTIDPVQSTAVHDRPALHISICICTYKRRQLLRSLLESLRRQRTDSIFSYSIVIVDNDRCESARNAVEEVAAGYSVPIRYCVEPQQNIALARNRAVAAAEGDFIAFIDDDEFPSGEWLFTLFHSLNAYRVDGVLGPVKPYFEAQVPSWVIKGNFYNRPSYKTGTVIDWRKGRTGNVLLRKHVFDNLVQPFRPEFKAGEDQDFFRRVIERGHVFTWCDEALAYEVVPPARWKRKFMLKRALLRGQVEPNNPTVGAASIGKSMIAVVIYAIVLPFALLTGHHRFMSCSVRLCDHLGKVLAAFGVHLISDPYVTE